MACAAPIYPLIYQRFVPSLSSLAVQASTARLAMVKKPKTEAMKKRKKLALKDKLRARKAGQALQPPVKRKRVDDDPAAQPDGAPAEGGRRTRRKKRATAAVTAAAEPEPTDAPEDGEAPLAKDEAAAPAQSTGGAKVACTLFVGQLPYSASANDVSRHFKKVASGGTVHVRMLASKEGKSRGMAFVELSCESVTRTRTRTRALTLILTPTPTPTRTVILTLTLSLTLTRTCTRPCAYTTRRLG